VATNFDDELPARLSGLPVREVFGSCDGAPVGHGRPHAVTPPVDWRRLARHVRVCREAGLAFNLLLNPLCLGGREGSRRLERRLRAAMSRAVDMGVTGVTVSHPWLLELVSEYRFEVRVGVFVGITTVEQARYWSERGAHVLTLDTHVVCRDLEAIRTVVDAGLAEVELPVNIGCLLRCPLARTHAARLAHSSLPRAQPIDPCVVWCIQEKRRDPINLVRSDFIRPEDLHHYQALGVRRFKIVDRSCSTDALLTRVRAYATRRWDGDLLELLGPAGSPPLRRRLPVWDALRHLGFRSTLRAMREAEQLLRPSLPWVLDNRLLDDLLLPTGCSATGCEACGHCQAVAGRAVRPRPE
jgi:collagenase-like PrtC family protease